MKKIVSICLTMLLILSCMATVVFATEETTNLIVNGTFDTDLSGWGYSTGGTTTWNEGGYATLPAESASALGQVINGITPGTTLFFESDVKVVDETQGILVYITWLTPTSEILSIALSVADAMEWTHISRYAVAPEGTTRLRVWFRNSNGNEQFSFDNVSLKIVDTDEYYPESANLSMETLNDNGDFPAGYKKSGNASIEKNVVFSGENAIKLSNTESGETSTVSFYLPVRKQQVGEHYELLLYYKLTDTSFTEGAENEGAKLSITDAKGNALSYYRGQQLYSGTKYFTKEFGSGDGWRQMMVFFTESGLFKVTVELSGVANLYIDEFVLRKASCIVNGDFQGLSADGIPAGWSQNVSTALDYWASDLKLIETLNADGKTYENTVQGNHTYNKNYLKQVIYAEANGLIKDTTYEIAVDYVRGTLSSDQKNTSPRLAEKGGIAGATSDTYISAVDAGLRNYFYVIYNESALDGSLYRMWFALSARVPGGYYDNVTMRPVEEKIEFTKDGEEIGAVAPGDIVKVSYMRPGVFGESEETKVQVTAALYKKDKENDTLVSVHSLSIKDAQAKAVFASSATAFHNAEATNGAGFVPAKANIDFEIPNDGNEYYIKAFAWSSGNALTPFIDTAEIYFAE